MDIVYQRFNMIFWITVWIMPALNGFFIYRLFTRFAVVKSRVIWKVLLYLLLAGSSGMVIWVGDHNLILTFPVYLAVCLCCTRGDRFGRMAVILTFFCMEMSVCALIDTYITFSNVFYYEYITGICRTVIYAVVYLLLKKKLPVKEISLPERLWKIILGLSVMPLCSMLAVVTLTDDAFFGAVDTSVLNNLGLAVLPFTLLTSFVILMAIVTFMNYDELEREHQLFEMREEYYHNLKQQEESIRLLRHDMRNHLTSVQSFLTEGNVEQALKHLNELLGSTAMQGRRQFCRNETANVVLQAKADAITRLGLEYDFRVEIPENIPVSDIDLCSLLGNALDNAVRAAAQAEDHRIVVRCRCDKGLLMLKMTNAYSGELNESLKTTKADKENHGMGLFRMREIATRYGGYLETNITESRFELIICLPLQKNIE